MVLVRLPRTFAEGHVVDHLDRGAARLVDDAHGHFGYDQHRKNQHHRTQPFPALQFLGGEGVGDERRNEAAEGDSGYSRQVVPRCMDCGGGVEDTKQAVGILIGVDFPHGAPSPRAIPLRYCDR